MRYANITIIERNEASQFGIEIVFARIAEAVLRDERAVLPIGVYNAKYGVTRQTHPSNRRCPMRNGKLWTAAPRSFVKRCGE
jgi:malate/lactate dehydrogenase